MTKVNCRKIPKLIKPLVGNTIVCYVAIGNGWKPWIKYRFHHHKIDLDLANLRNYCTNLFEFLYGNKSYFSV